MTFSRAHAQPVEPVPASTGASPAAPAPEPPVPPPPVAPPPPAAAPPATLPGPAAATPATAPAPPAHDCQECKHRIRAADYKIGFLIGGGFFDLSDLNDRLAANGYERLEGPMLVIGGEGRSIAANGFVFGGHGAGIMGATGDGPGALETEWSGGYGMADFGYAPIRLSSFLLAITAGIGGYGMSLDIADNRDVDFEDVLDAPRRSTTLTRGGLAFGLTLHIDARIPLGPVLDTHHGYLALGVRLSGIFGPALGHWSLPDDDDAEGGPTTGLTGAYAAFVLGWGGTAVVTQ
jgi:hypothetical protein